MNLAARYNAVLHAGLLLAMVAFAAADERPMLVAVALLGVGLSWAFSRGKRADKPATLPRGAINLLVLAAIGNAALAAAGARREDPVVSTLGQFLVHVTLVKLFDRRGERDEAQLVALGVFDAVAAMLTSNALLVGAALIVYVPTAVASSMLLQLVWGRRRAEQRSGGAALASARAEAPGAGRGFAGVCAASVLISAAMATVVFVLTPRGLGSDFLGQFGMVRERQIGYREDVKLGESGFLSEDPTPVMDVRVETADGENIGSATQALYLRGSARDAYGPASRAWEETGQARGQSVDALWEWSVPWQSRESDGQAAESVAVSQIVERATTRVLTVTMRGEPASGAVFTLWRPVSVTPDRTVQLAFKRRSGTIKRTGGGGGRVTYRIRSTSADDSVNEPWWPPGFQAGFVREFAERVLADRTLVEGERTVRQVATAFRNHLRENYQYTTILTAPPSGQDPIEFFLRDHKEGHCEYFASAMAALCQSVGLHARVVTGYYAAEFNGLTGQYVVRQSNAHAWCEVYVRTEGGGGRWETFDPSPQGDIERIHRPAGGLMAQLRSWYEALEFGWSTSVVGFDSLRQAQILKRDPQVAAESSRGILKVSDRLAAWLRTVRADRQLPVWLRVTPGLLLVGVIAGILAGPLWRRFGPKWARVKRAPAVRGMRRLSEEPPYYRRALKALGRAGIGKPGWSPPVAHAGAIQDRVPNAAGPLRALAALYYRARFGGVTLTPAEAAAAESHAAEIERALREARRAGRHAGVR